MAILEGNVSECKKQIEKILKKIDEEKYKIDYTMIKVGTEETESVKDKDGKSWSTSKRNFHDEFIISYIDEEADPELSKDTK